MSAHPGTRSPDASRRRRITVLAAVFVGGMIAALPSIISRTSLRNALLQRIVGDANLQVSSSGASLGWFSPLVIDELQIVSADGGVLITADQVRCEKSWPQLWLSSPEIGVIEVDKPNVEIVIADEATPQSRRGRVRSCATFSTVMTNGSLLVREAHSEEPSIDLSDIDVTLHTEQRDGGAVLIVEPIMIAQRQPLTPEACEQGLQLIAPVLADEVGLEGEYSLELTGLQLALGAADQRGENDGSKLEGVLTLHHVSAGLTNDVTRRLVLAAAELMKWEDTPETIRLAEQVELSFRLADGKLSHRGMAMFLPQVAPGFSINTLGRVDWDETVELEASLQVPATLLGGSSLAGRLAETPLKLQVTGTIDAPVLSVPQDQAWVSSVDEVLAKPDRTPEESRLANRLINAFGRLGTPPQAPSSSP